MTLLIQARKHYQNEYDVLCQLPSHKNIIHMWAFFYDRPGPRELKYLQRQRSGSRGMALFILMDEHPQSMADHVQTLVDNKGPYVSATEGCIMFATRKNDLWLALYPIIKDDSNHIFSISI